eukprot:6396424-Pyramimonas_sp.AAC.1
MAIRTEVGAREPAGAPDGRGRRQERVVREDGRLHGRRHQARLEGEGAPPREGVQKHRDEESSRNCEALHVLGTRVYACAHSTACLNHNVVGQRGEKEEEEEEGRDRFAHDARIRANT